MEEERPDVNISLILPIGTPNIVLIQYAGCAYIIWLLKGSLAPTIIYYYIILPTFI